jgi:hypothetical protein
MDELGLEPYAVKLRIARPVSVPGAGFGSEVAGFIEAFAKRCAAEENALIGHIKGFAAGQDGSYLWVSVTDPRRFADVEGEIKGDPQSVMLTLNVHVFGLSKKRIKALLTETAADPAVRDRVRISPIEPLGLDGLTEEGEG